MRFGYLAILGEANGAAAAFIYRSMWRMLKR